MRKPAFLQWVWTLVLASALATGCNSQPASTPGGEPSRCTAAPLGDYVILPDLGSPARGSVAGSEIAGLLCDGGASAYMERTSATTSPPNQLDFLIDSYTSDPASNFQIALPTGATRLQLSVTIGPSAAQPGIYTEGNACGLISLCAIMPPTLTPADCSTTADVCPPGCTRESNCVPAEPAICYEADTNPICNGAIGSGQGSWRLTLSSVEPYTGSDGGVPGYEIFVTHGSLDASLVRTDAKTTDTSTASLSLSF